MNQSQRNVYFVKYLIINTLIVGLSSYKLACSTKDDFLFTEERITVGHNKLAARLLELEQAQNKLRRPTINNFRLTCKVGIEAGVMPENAVKEALEGVRE